MNAAAQRAADRIAIIEREIKRFMDSAIRRSEMDGVRRRRQRVRYHRSWPLAVFDPDQMPGTCVAAALHNASNQGIAFLTHRRFEIGATVLIRLFWHDDQSPKAPAVIRHVTPTPDGYLIGCEFDPYWCRRSQPRSGQRIAANPTAQTSHAIHASSPIPSERPNPKGQAIPAGQAIPSGQPIHRPTANRTNHPSSHYGIRPA